MLDAERNLFNNEISYTQTQGTVFASLVGLYQAMGGGWVVDAEHMTGVEPAPQTTAGAR